MRLERNRSSRRDNHDANRSSAIAKLRRALRGRKCGACVPASQTNSNRLKLEMEQILAFNKRTGRSKFEAGFN
jgi:hypothetical protein